MAQIGNIYTDANGTEYTKHPVARVSKVKDDAHLYDLVDTANAIDQGANLVPGDHVDGELQLRVATTPAIGDAIVFVCDDCYDGIFTDHGESLSEIPQQSDHAGNFWSPLCGSNAVLYLSDQMPGGRSLSCMADLYFFLGMRYLCILGRNYDG